MFHIFREELDDVFRRDAKLIWKLLAAAVVGLILGIKFTARFWFASEESRHGATPLASICITAAIIVVSVLAVLLLSLRDIVRERIREGQPVNFLLRCYLGSRLVSLGLWALTFIIAVLLVTMGWVSWFG
ncbi:MAG: hypothetical protein ABR915_19405 [Thermoguttaceae bacterium]